MEENSQIVKCGNCKQILDVRPEEPSNKRTPCPSCGSISRLFEVTATAKVGVYAGLRMKAKHKGEKKPFVEERSGKELFRKTGEYADRTMVVDRDNDLYKEIIRDPKTGEIIHLCEEPLSKHIGHGDAKMKKV